VLQRIRPKGVGTDVGNSGSAIVQGMDQTAVNGAQVREDAQLDPEYSLT
jgi:hypothetical protein